MFLVHLFVEWCMGLISVSDCLFVVLWRKLIPAENAFLYLVICVFVRFIFPWHEWLLDSLEAFEKQLLPQLILFYEAFGSIESTVLVVFREGRKDRGWVLNLFSWSIHLIEQLWWRRPESYDFRLFLQLASYWYLRCLKILVFLVGFTFESFCSLMDLYAACFKFLGILLKTWCVRLLSWLWFFHVSFMALINLDIRIPML